MTPMPSELELELELFEFEFEFEFGNWNWNWNSPPHPPPFLPSPNLKLELQLDDKLEAEFDALMAIGHLTSLQEARLSAEMRERRELFERRRAARKTKKRRKKKLPRSGGARHPHRQRHVRYAGFAGSDAPRDVFPVVDDWPLMLGIMAGMDQKDSGIVVIMAVA